jgi:hypothetical protein
MKPQGPPNGMDKIRGFAVHLASAVVRVDESYTLPPSRPARIGVLPARLPVRKVFSRCPE